MGVSSAFSTFILVLLLVLGGTQEASAQFPFANPFRCLMRGFRETLGVVRSAAPPKTRNKYAAVPTRRRTVFERIADANSAKGFQLVHVDDGLLRDSAGKLVELPRDGMYYMDLAGNFYLGQDPQQRASFGHSSIAAAGRILVRQGKIFSLDSVALGVDPGKAALVSAVTELAADGAELNDAHVVLPDTHPTHVAATSIAGHPREIYEELYGRLSTSELAAAQRTIESPASLSATARPFRVEVACASAPYKAGEPSGDFVRMIAPGDGSLHAVVGDVQGHGRASGVIAMGIQSSIESAMALREFSGKRPHEVLTKLEERAVPKLRGAFLALADLRYLPATKSIEFAAASNIYGFVLSKDGTVHPISDGDGFMMGLPFMTYANANPRSVSRSVKPGDIVILTSDGLPDMIPEIEQHASPPDAIQAALAALPAAQRTPSGVVKFLTARTTLATDRDDLTVMALGIP